MDSDRGFSTDFEWTKNSDRCWLLKGCTRHIIVKQPKDSDSWGVILMDVTQGQNKFLEILLQPTCSYETAFFVAEEWARNHRSIFSMSDYHAPWKKQDATVKQVDLLIKYKLWSAPSPWPTKGEAARIINKQFNR